MQSDYLNQKKERAQFAELPQPGKVSKTKVKTDNVYLSELESYTEELGEHLLKIQNEEIEKNRRFTETLKALDKEQNSQAKEEEERKRYAADIAKLRELRKFYRERMYDAVEDKKNLLESARLQKIQEERIRRQLADLDLLPEGKSTATNRTITIFDTASLLLIIFQIVLGVLFGLLTDFTNEYAMERLWGSASRIASNYEFFIHISLFLFVGIGLLMSWMRRAGFSGIGYTFLISAFTLQWALLVMQFASQSGSSVNEDNFQWHNVDLSIDNLIEGLYGAISVVIGMGAIIGIANPVTLLWYAVMQIPFYALNYFIGHYLLFAQDLGGSIFVFTFGAFFGVSFGYIYNARRIVLDAKELSSYHSELFAFLGTVFLFVLFPSYNAAFAPDGTQHRVAINTVLSLCASVVFAFIFSRVFRGGHFRMSDVQRATIAGGIAMASISSFLIAPGGAIVTGAVAGAVVCLAVVHITPSLERRGLHDTFGVLPTWGVSGLIGALTGIISAGIATSKDSIFGQSMETIFPDRGTAQAGWNVIALIITLAIAIVGGLICGGVAKFFDSVVFGKAGATRVQFSDEQDWVVPQDFELTSFKDESKTEGTRQ